MDLLVSYAWYDFQRAKSEIIRILQDFGDPTVWVKKSAVFGIAIVRTRLDNRALICKCRDLFNSNPRAFHWALKWLPVDYWCDTDLNSIKKVIDERIKDQIQEDQTWGMVVKKRCWQEYHSINIVKYLAEDIDRQVNLSNPDWLVWVDVLGSETAISLLRPDDIFSLNLPTFSWLNSAQDAVQTGVFPSHARSSEG